MRRRGGGVEKGNAIVQYCKELRKGPQKGRDLETNECGDHAGLFTALRATLEIADRFEMGRTGSGARSLSELHRALCVLQKQQWAPVTMLSCLWGVDEGEAESICKMLEEISACEIEYRVVNGSEVKGVRVHDLVHEYYLTAARKEEEVQGWHVAVVDGYWQRYVEGRGRSKRGRRKNGKGDRDGGSAGWLSDKMVEDLYIHRNLSRHLVESGKANELEILLLDYRWTMKQLRVNRCLGVESNFRELLRSRKQQRKERVEKNVGGSVQRQLRLRNTCISSG